MGAAILLRPCLATQRDQQPDRESTLALAPTRCSSAAMQEEPPAREFSAAAPYHVPRRKHATSMGVPVFRRALGSRNGRPAAIGAAPHSHDDGFTRYAAPSEPAPELSAAFPQGRIQWSM